MAAQEEDSKGLLARGELILGEPPAGSTQSAMQHGTSTAFRLVFRRLLTTSTDSELHEGATGPTGPCKRTGLWL